MEVEARRRWSAKSVNQLWRAAFRLRSSGFVGQVACEGGLPAVARRIEDRFRSKAGAEGGLDGASALWCCLVLSGVVQYRRVSRGQ